MRACGKQSLTTQWCTAGNKHSNSACSLKCHLSKHCNPQKEWAVSKEFLLNNILADLCSHNRCLGKVIKAWLCIPALFVPPQHYCISPLPHAAVVVSLFGCNLSLPQCQLRWCWLLPKYFIGSALTSAQNEPRLWHHNRGSAVNRVWVWSKLFSMCTFLFDCSQMFAVLHNCLQGMNPREFTRCPVWKAGTCSEVNYLVSDKYNSVYLEWSCKRARSPLLNINTVKMPALHDETSKWWRMWFFSQNILLHLRSSFLPFARTYRRHTCILFYHLTIIFTGLWQRQ